MHKTQTITATTGPDNVYPHVCISRPYSLRQVVLNRLYAKLVDEFHERGVSYVSETIFRRAVWQCRESDTILGVVQDIRAYIKRERAQVPAPDIALREYYGQAIQELIAFSVRHNLIRVSARN